MWIVLTLVLTELLLTRSESIELTTTITLLTLYHLCLPRETDRFFSASGVQLPSTNSGLFHFRRAVFASRLKSRVVLALAKDVRRTWSSSPKRFLRKPVSTKRSIEKRSCGVSGNISEAPRDELPPVGRNRCDTCVWWPKKSRAKSKDSTQWSPQTEMTEENKFRTTMIVNHGQNKCRTTMIVKHGLEDADRMGFQGVNKNTWSMC